MYNRENEREKMITRKDYLENSSKLHRAYYAQFVTNDHKNRVRLIGLDRILESKDKNFNDIPLDEWDRRVISPVPLDTVKLMKECGDYPTRAGSVCILKEAAQQIVDHFNMVD
jgi:hypothetical protein